VIGAHGAGHRSEFSCVHPIFQNPCLPDLTAASKLIFGRYLLAFRRKILPPSSLPNSKPNRERYSYETSQADKKCLNKTHSQIHIDKYLSDNVRFQNGLKQGDALSPLLLNFALEYDVSKVQGNPRWTKIIWDTSASELC
jgi:hypothetical protein